MSTPVRKDLTKASFWNQIKKAACFLVSSLLFEQKVLGLDIDILDFQLFCFNPIIPSKRQQKRKSAGATARYALEGLASRPTSSERLSRLSRSRRLRLHFALLFQATFHNPQLFYHEFPKRIKKVNIQKGQVSPTSPLAWHQFHQRAQSLSLVRCIRFTNEHRAWCSASPEVSDPDTPQKMWATTGKKFWTSKMITLLRLQWRVPWKLHLARHFASVIVAIKTIYAEYHHHALGIAKKPEVTWWKAAKISAPAGPHLDTSR